MQSKQLLAAARKVDKVKKQIASVEAQEKKKQDELQALRSRKQELMEKLENCNEARAQARAKPEAESDHEDGGVDWGYAAAQLAEAVQESRTGTEFLEPAPIHELQALFAAKATAQERKKRLRKVSTFRYRQPKIFEIGSDEDGESEADSDVEMGPSPSPPTAPVATPLSANKQALGPADATDGYATAGEECWAALKKAKTEDGNCTATLVVPASPTASHGPEVVSSASSSGASAVVQGAAAADNTVPESRPASGETAAAARDRSRSPRGEAPPLD